MKNYNQTLQSLIEQRASFDSSTALIEHKGRAGEYETIVYNPPKGPKSDFVKFCHEFEAQYNTASKQAAIETIEAQIASELEAERVAEQNRVAAEAEAEKQREEAEKTLKAQYEAQLEAEREKQAELIEKINSTPKYQLVSTFVLGWLLKLLITVVLVGLNGANGEFFLGGVLADTYIWTFAGLFGGMYLYTSLYKDADAFYWVRLVLPADLALAVFVKPFIGGEALKFNSLWELISTGAGWGMILFVLIYGVQIFHAGNALFKFLNPNIDKEDVKEYRNNVLNVVKK